MQFGNPLLALVISNVTFSFIIVNDIRRPLTILCAGDVLWNAFSGGPKIFSEKVFLYALFPFLSNFSWATGTILDYDSIASS